ncbi:phage head-binding domain-containing protein [Serratia ureilytica]|uniref:phage head-binding domain-containing protein n=1 Tax=Serratia ureilytica TaxID=300181 RepID=UPI00384E0E4A
MADIVPNVVVSQPSQLFTLARSFKANANGRIYIGKIDTDPTIPENQIQVYLENEDGSLVPMAQPIMINAGGYPVYSGQIAKFVTVEGHSMAIYDAFGVQQFYFPNVLKYDPDQLRQQLAGPDGVKLVGNAVDKRDLAGDDSSLQMVDHVHVFNDVSISFREFLTVKDGSVDATPAMIAACASGKTVEIPHDYVIRLDSANIPVTPGTRIIGQFGGRPTILINHTDTVNPQFSGGIFNVWSNIRFRYPKQKLNLGTGESPIAYGALFEGPGYFSEFSNLDVGNTYYAFKFGTSTSSSSKITMYNIIGAPLFRGLSLDACLDVPRISDIHWNYNYLRDYSLPGENYAYGDTLKAWMGNNATAFHVGRCDFATFFRLFSYGYWRGIYLRSERRTGSAENTRFVGCDQDMSTHPIWIQNWENRVSVLDCKLVGSIASGFATTDNTYCYIADNGSTTSLAVIDNVDFGGFNNNALSIGCNLSISNSKIHDYGINTAAQGNGIIQSANGYLTITNTVIDCGTTALRQTRAIFANSSISAFTVGEGCQFLNQTVASYEWRFGPNYIDESCVISAPAHGGLTFISNVPKTYYCESIPTAGNYFKMGDYAKKTKPVIETAGGARVVKGWVRLTNSNAAGTNHVLNTDWVEDRTYYI